MTGQLSNIGSTHLSNYFEKWGCINFKGCHLDIPGNQMFVIFYTNGNIGRKGFKASVLESMQLLSNTSTFNISK